MTALRKTIHQLGEKFDCQAERLAFLHPAAAILVMFLVIPVFILFSVMGLTMLASLVMTVFFL